jgi:hypothetical protein
MTRDEFGVSAASLIPPDPGTIRSCGFRGLAKDLPYTYALILGVEKGSCGSSKLSVRDRWPNPNIRPFYAAGGYPKETRNPLLPDSTTVFLHGSVSRSIQKAEPKIKEKPNVTLHRHYALAALLRTTGFLLRNSFSACLAVASDLIPVKLDRLVTFWAPK